MDMVGLEKNGQLCEAMFHLCFWKFQDSHESVLNLVLGEQPFALNTCFCVRGDAFKIEDVEKYGAETPRSKFMITGHHWPMYSCIQNYI